ncbi:cupin domain-containing protein [Salinivirga cyanobacteriivorans]
MEINYWKDKDIKENPHGLDVREVYHHSNAQIMHINLNPGEVVKPHKTPVDVFFVVMEGEIEFNIGDEINSAEKEAIVHSPANIMHALANKTDNKARVLVAKTPSPNKT